MGKLFVAMLVDESGVSMTEYAVILSLLSVGAMAALIGISANANTAVSTAAANTTAYQTGPPP